MTRACPRRAARAATRRGKVCAGQPFSRRIHPTGRTGSTCMFRSARVFAVAAVIALAAPLAAQNADVHGTWTAELRDGKLFLQVHTSPPADWNGDRWRGDWNMGQSIPIDEVGGLPRNDTQFTVSSLKFELRREA